MNPENAGPNDSPNTDQSDTPLVSFNYNVNFDFDYSKICFIQALDPKSQYICVKENPNTGDVGCRFACR